MRNQSSDNQHVVAVLSYPDPIKTGTFGKIDPKNAAYLNHRLSTLPILRVMSTHL